MKHKLLKIAATLLAGIITLNICAQPIGTLNNPSETAINLHRSNATTASDDSPVPLIEVYH